MDKNTYAIVRCRNAGVHADLSPIDLATAADVAPRTVRRWIRVGYLPAVRATPASPWRIRRADAAEFLARLGRELPAVSP